MPVTQISRIQVRRGRREQLPQLSAGELGWCQDTRQLFIGNGDFSEGALALGNTEILTEFSDAAQIQQAQQVQTSSLINNTSTAQPFATVALVDVPAGQLRYRLSIVRSTEPATAHQTGVLSFAHTGDLSTVTVDDVRTGDANIQVTFSAALVSNSIIEFSYVSAENTDGQLRFVISEF